MIKDIKSPSMVDYPGEVVATIFTKNCNLRCEYCHNFALIDNDDESMTDKQAIQELVTKVDRSRGIITGVTITGGEPTVHGHRLTQLIVAIRKIMGAEFKIKLDTNGMNPDTLMECILAGVDYVALDYKSLDYSTFSFSTKEGAEQRLDTCINMLSKSGVDHEVRVTMYPRYVKLEDAIDFANVLKVPKRVFLQQFDKRHMFLETDCEPYSEEQIEGFKDVLVANGVTDVQIRI